MPPGPGSSSEWQPCSASARRWWTTSRTTSSILVYGVLAVSVVPGAAIVASGRTGQRQAVVWAIAGIVLVILVFRLFQTGG